ncbi:unnamed protein product [Kluyveromyces dobzhanskii CBS 2104]|uniref:WGS project CCBQ000000000 data, contig 00007 n=1 Tax=Kluyveromyces dobzhanskii CBS 2104 TaxID=1427455 RepID=A0A0A8L5K1_9SACH|nr:unnamed protein product [Kluyveromyces dobzhanskii CBS 2104]
MGIKVRGDFLRQLFPAEFWQLKDETATVLSPTAILISLATVSKASNGMTTVYMTTCPIESTTTENATKSETEQIENSSTQDAAAPETEKTNTVTESSTLVTPEDTPVNTITGEPLSSFVMTESTTIAVSKTSPSSTPFFTRTLESLYEGSTAKLFVTPFIIVFLALL